MDGSPLQSDTAVMFSGMTLSKLFAVTSASTIYSSVPFEGTNLWYSALVYSGKKAPGNIICSMGGKFATRMSAPSLFFSRLRTPGAATDPTTVDILFVFMVVVYS